MDQPGGFGLEDVAGPEGPLPPADPARGRGLAQRVTGVGRHDVDDRAGLDESGHPPRGDRSPADDEDATAVEAQGGRVGGRCR